MELFRHIILLIKENIVPAVYADKLNVIPSSMNEGRSVPIDVTARKDK